ncbi:MAG: DEAD/DEAH box helicase [Vulcanimicrobiota bacterium]
MKTLLQEAKCLTEALEAAEALGALDWQGQSVMACLQCFLRATAPSDRGALLRELVRLCEGIVSLPFRPEIESLGADILARYGLRSNLRDERIYLSLAPGRPGVESDFLKRVAWACQLDRLTRRPYPPTLADGSLRRLMGRDGYRTPTQKAAARAAMMMPGDGSLLVTMPTGAGKSLIFHLATLWWIEGTAPGRACSVVVVPTVSLALDHERTARAIPGLEGSRALRSDLAPSLYQETLEAFRRGEVPILFVSPEAAMGRARDALLEAATSLAEKTERLQARLMGFFVDEVHIVESWGRSFRPDFQRLPALAAELRERNSSLRTILLSATVSDSALELLKASYGTDQFLSLSAGVARYEFDWMVNRCPNREERHQQALQALDLLPRPCIVYTTTRDDAEHLYRDLGQRGYQRLRMFTGDTSGLERQDIIQEWATDQVDLVVATSAFGMGINKSNVRAVLHACLPENASRYYQEVGRGGRDGHQCLALCLWCPEDLRTARGLSTSEWLTPEMAATRWQALLDDARGNGGLRSNKGSHEVTVRLDAAHQALGSKTGGRNRDWNRRLLNLLQRGRAIELLTDGQADHDSPVWRFRVLKPEIFGSGPEALASLNALRDAEQHEVNRQLQVLQALVEHPESQCLLAGLFEFVEAGQPMPQYCGHCAWCHAQGITPPEKLHFGGLDEVWPLRPPRREVFPSGVSALQHGGDLMALIPRLQRAGLQQFLVPDGEGEQALRVVGEQPGLGLVLEFSMVLRQDWAPAEMPTAVFFTDERPQNDSMMSWVRKRSKRHPNHVWLLVAPPNIGFEERGLNVLASQAPYDEAQLEALIRKEPVTP